MFARALRAPRPRPVARLRDSRGWANGSRTFAKGLGGPANPRRVTAVQATTLPQPQHRCRPKGRCTPRALGGARACRQVTMRSTESASAGCGSAALSPSSSMAAMASMLSALARLAAPAPAPGSSRMRSSSFVSAPARAAAASARDPAECKARLARTCTACWTQRSVLLRRTVAGSGGRRSCAASRQVWERRTESRPPSNNRPDPGMLAV